MNHIDQETSTTIHGGVEGAVRFFDKKGIWKGQRPRALEPLAISKSLQDCVLQVKKHYIIKRAQAHERMAARLRREAEGIIK
jgi:hypothetical protein